MIRGAGMNDQCGLEPAVEWHAGCKCGLHWLIWFVFGLTLLRGLRFPNLWSYTHSLFSWEMGFSKRALWGELVRRTGWPWLASYPAFSMISFLLIALIVVLLGRILLHLHHRHGLLGLGGGLVFASSMSAVFLAHTVGYADHLGMLVALVALLIKRFEIRLIWLLITFPVVIMVHEAVAVLYFPLVWVACWVLAGRRLNGKKMVGLLLLLAVVVTTTVCVSRAQLTRNESLQMRSVIAVRLESVAGELRPDAFVPLYRPAASTLEKNRSMWQNEKRKWDFLNSLAVTLIPYLLMAGMAVWLLYRAQVSRIRTGLLVLASLSPLSLHLVAWDMHRWNSLLGVTGLMLLFVASQSKDCFYQHHRVAPQEGTGEGADLPETTNIIAEIRVGEGADPPESDETDHRVEECVDSRLEMSRLSQRARKLVLALCLVVVVLNFLSTIPLFDRYTVQSFPFEKHQQWLRGWIQGEEMWRIPTR